jgi:Peptidase family M28
MRTPLRAAVTVWLLGAVAGLAAGQVAQPASTAGDDFVAAGPVQPLPAPLAAALAGIKAPALAARVGFLASPALEGRGLGSRGFDAAAEYAAAELALAGVPPLAAGGYFQAVPVREITSPAGEVVVERSAGGATSSRRFASGVDCAFAGAAPGGVAAPVVFASFGVREPALGRDDYRGLDVRGKVVLVLAGVPAGTEWTAPALVERYAAKDADERWAAKLASARALGAAAVLAVEDEPLAVASSARAEPYFLPFAPAAPATVAVRVTPALAGAVLAAAGLDAATARDAGPRELPGVRVRLTVTGSERLIESRNVVGAIAGSDPERRGEAVVIGAHLDHLGKAGDTVYPGADDNASGVAALLEIARAFAAAPERPRRTLVFAFWTGEEEGKFGSGWWVGHPLWPLERTTAYLNLDMIGHPWSAAEVRKLVEESHLPGGEAFLANLDPAQFVEPGLPPDAPALAAALREAARGTGLALHLDRTDGRSGGSDYRDFARAGVPFVRFFGNFFPAYHEPGDTAAALDATQVQRVARLAFATAWLLAGR